MRGICFKSGSTSAQPRDSGDNDNNTLYIMQGFDHIWDPLPSEILFLISESRTAYAGYAHLRPHDPFQRFALKDIVSSREKTNPSSCYSSEDKKKFSET